MKRPVESDYTSHVAYTCALEEYCDVLEQPAPVQEPEWKQVEEGLRFHGLTLVKTGTGYAVLKLGTVQAQTTSLAQPAHRKPLTEDQKLMCWSRATHDADVEHKTEHQCLMDYGSEIEAAHSIKENT